MLRRILKGIAWLIGLVIMLVAALMIYVRLVASVELPVVSASDAFNPELVERDTGLMAIDNGWFRKSESGLYELYVEGTPYERGLINGKLTREQVQYQEEVFNKQIEQLVPSSIYRNMLTYFIGWFNRDLDEHIPIEYREEIYGVSQAASHDYDNIAPAYQRIMNYHAAHDIGHALQNMSLVGCTSFATWGTQSEDSTLIIGRNFDFYVGDDFARDKIIAFYNPDKGYKFMMVTFGGMIGVLSGMNEAGLTVTINAAKSEIPSASATPVSLVAREMLQYASTIDEAYAIAAKRKMFVAESFLIGSANDHKAAVIEKTPNGIGFYEQEERIVCTNHFQSDSLGNTQLNKDHMRTSASPYRFDRVNELLDRNRKNSVAKTAAILRNQQGMDDADIGLGNEKAINQLVAHHGIIFQPEKRLVWISTAAWQLGKFVCYDLNKVFTMTLMRNEEIYEADNMIEADTFLNSTNYKAYLKFSKFRFPFAPRTGLQPDSIVAWNPKSYHAFMLAGDACMDTNDYERARVFYEQGLALEVATAAEREHMQQNLATCKEKLK